ncbi:MULTISPECIES: thioredoxin [Pseudomonas]|jgi:thioredoxin 1|uniref:thioredoxin n=1 Tax=Pseudomonas TaxID=286 RepID=UPI00054B6983|nr:MULTISPECIES: thioredoxin [Pseudomonas]MBB4814052.1 thioredoxin 1 [Pseudomonas rhodesiae]MBX4134949.1 thioredoxin [Pseudomonas sp. S5F11]MDN6863937.1 thioredoxin [Pseudomonas rhodesiae]NMZ16876.1 thioredoxin [Pseudomonas rhodesiae]PHN42283.1 thioredoxin [Pseudomonas sp. ICMP 564]
MSQIKAITDASFEDDVIHSTKPVLVDFWAEWCGPCKMLAVSIEQIAEEYADRLQVATLNVDENPATPQTYGIRSIPTLMLFSGGHVEGTQIGAITKSRLISFLDGKL